MLLAVVSFLASIVATTGSPAPVAVPSSDERAAYERGRSYERIVLANVNRSWYGIALFQTRFAADLDAMESEIDFTYTADEKKNLFEPMRTFLESGDASTLPKAFGDWNGFDPYGKPMASTEPIKSSPTQAWFVEAGMADVEVHAAGDELALQLMAADHPKWLADHASDGGPFAEALGAPQTATSADVLLSLESKVEREFDVLCPEGAFATLAYPAGLVGDAQLGIAVSTIDEMVDSPPLLAQPESQAFVRATVTELDTLATTEQARATVDSLRNALTVDASFQRDAAGDRMSAVIAAVIRPLPEERRDAFFTGLMAAQAPYNAAVFRDPSAAGQQLGTLGNLTALDPADAAAAGLRKQLIAVKPMDWASVVKIGRALVDEIASHR